MITLMNADNIAGRRHAPWWFVVAVVGVALAQAAAIVHWLRLPDDLIATLNAPVWLVVGGYLLWAIMLGWAAWNLILGKPQAVNRSIWLLSVFIIYSVLRLLVFSQADYDRQRYPLLVALIPFVSILVLCFRIVWSRSCRVGREQIMEKNSDGSRPQDSGTPPQT